jgi:peptidoglycan L-alanyl-D-glutamate endopeptidase CwlK
MDRTSELRLTMVMPALAEKIHQLANMMSLDVPPMWIVVSAGYRTWAEQDQLFAIGRSVPGKKVTDARGGYSWHNFGCAVDCAPEVISGQIDWSPDHPQWKKMEDIGESLGLTSGATWTRLVDAPHFQLTGHFPEGAPDDEARQIYQSQGQEALWKIVTGG